MKRAYPVTACLVTRGDVDMGPVVKSIPRDWEILVWDNGAGKLIRVSGRTRSVLEDVADLKVYGRYAATEFAGHETIYVQDDDVIVDDLWGLADWWWSNEPERDGAVACNMPPEFRHSFYEEHALVGFGAMFHRNTLWEAIVRFNKSPVTRDLPYETFLRTCDIAFTALTPRTLVDWPKHDREMASDPSRVWTTAGHQQEREKVLAMALEVARG